MRTIMYGVFNKETKERIYTDSSYTKCEKFIEAQTNSENLEIRHKWFSI